MQKDRWWSSWNVLHGFTSSCSPALPGGMGWQTKAGVINQGRDWQGHEQHGDTQGIMSPQCPWGEDGRQWDLSQIAGRVVSACFIPWKSVCPPCPSHKPCLCRAWQSFAFCREAGLRPGAFFQTGRDSKAPLSARFLSSDLLFPINVEKKPSASTPRPSQHSSQGRLSTSKQRGKLKPATLRKTLCFQREYKEAEENKWRQNTGLGTGLQRSFYPLVRHLTAFKPWEI